MENRKDKIHDITEGKIQRGRVEGFAEQESLKSYYVIIMKEVA